MRVVVATCMALALGAHSTFAQSEADTAFVDVNVVPMDENRVLRNQTVVVRDGTIVAIGPAPATDIPAGAQRIEGHGRSFLMPGLADMHTHVNEEEDFALFIANGVTTVLHMGLAPSHFVLGINELIERGDVVGPRIFFAMIIDGTRDSQLFFASSPEQARQAVGLAKTNGYDFIKVYNSLTALQFAAIVEEGRRVGLPVIGHGVRAVGLPQQLFEGQVMVAHAEEFYYTAFRNQTDVAAIPSIVAEVRRSGGFVTPNLSFFQTISEQWGKPAVVEAFMRAPQARLMSPNVRLQWLLHNPYTRRTGSIETMVPFLREFTKALADSGVPLLTGTDSPLPGMFPGYSVHDDIRALIDAGLSPYQALTAATRAPGEFIGKYVPTAPRFGTVEVGMKADLVLVKTNPLETVGTLESPLGVMSAGRWRSATDLAALLEKQRATYDSVMK